MSPRWSVEILFGENLRREYIHLARSLFLKKKGGRGGGGVREHIETSAECKKIATKNVQLDSIPTSLNADDGFKFNNETIASIKRFFLTGSSWNFLSAETDVQYRLDWSSEFNYFMNTIGSKKERKKCSQTLISISPMMQKTKKSSRERFKRGHVFYRLFPCLLQIRARSMQTLRTFGHINFDIYLLFDFKDIKLPDAVEFTYLISLERKDIDFCYKLRRRPILTWKQYIYYTAQIYMYLRYIEVFAATSVQNTMDDGICTD